MGMNAGGGTAGTVVNTGQPREAQNASGGNVNPFAGRGVTLGSESNQGGGGLGGFFGQQQVYDEMQKNQADLQLREKAREAAIKRERDQRNKKEQEENQK